MSGYAKDLKWFVWHTMTRHDLVARFASGEEANVYVNAAAGNWSAHAVTLQGSQAHAQRIKMLREWKAAQESASDR